EIELHRTRRCKCCRRGEHAARQKNCLPNSVTSGFHDLLFLSLPRRNRSAARHPSPTTAIPTVPGSGIVSTLMLHPSGMDPESGELSSSTNRLQVPFGFAPLNTESVAGAFALPAGAGLENSKGNVGFKRVGLNVPDVNAESSGNEFAAESSNVSVKFETGSFVAVPP